MIGAGSRTVSQVGGPDGPRAAGGGAFGLAIQGVLG